MPLSTDFDASLAATAGLRTVSLLAHLSVEALRDIARRCIWRRFDPGQRIVSRDATDSDVFFVVTGSVRVTAFSASGRQLIYRDLQAGEWFGDLAAIDRRVRSADVVALSESLLGRLVRDDFMRLLFDNPSAANAELQHLVRWVRALTERLFDLSTLDVQHRVRAELLRLAQQAGADGNVARIQPAPTHAEIASQISTYREQVSRELSQLARDGIVERRGSALIVLDVERLQRLLARTRAGA